jgi:hypothetical protein
LLSIQNNEKIKSIINRLKKLYLQPTLILAIAAVATKFNKTIVYYATRAINGTLDTSFIRQERWVGERVFNKRVSKEV